MIITLIINCDECSHLSVETFYGIIRKTLRKVFVKEYAKDINEFIEISMLQVLVLVKSLDLTYYWMVGVARLFNTIFKSHIYGGSSYAKCILYGHLLSVFTFSIKTKQLFVLILLLSSITLLCKHGKCNLSMFSKALLNLRRVAYN